MNLFDSLNSFSDIQQLIDDVGSPDGETSSFELKGTNGRPIPNRDDKTSFAKEICAFANSYGGTLCINKGKDTDIRPFEELEAIRLIRLMESWSRDSLEPPSPMRLKNIDNLLLIEVSESLTKPHRSARDKLYYYRHETQSAKMPEIMIASLYRGQSVLEIELAISLSITNHNSRINIFAGVKNLSRVAGTSPKVQVQLFSRYVGVLNYQGQSIDDTGVVNHTVPMPYHGADWVSWNGVFSSNNDFQSKVLYPEDSLMLNAIAEPCIDNPNKELPRYLVIRMDAMLLECTRRITYFLYDLEYQGEGASREKLMMKADENESQELFTEFRRLTK